MTKYFTVLSVCIFIFVTLLGRVSSSTADRCSTPNCNPNNYKEFFSIHFPFRLPNLNSNPNCAYSDHFTLSCGQKNETLLHLPTAGSFNIESINYYQQSLYITDPNNCFFQRIFDGFDLSDSPFSTDAFITTETYTYYNCTSPVSHGSYHFYDAYCMSGVNYTIIVTSDGQREISNCTAIKTVLAPGMPSSSVQLFWYEPYCRTCLLEEGVCGFKVHTRTFGCDHITKNHGLSGGAKYAVILGITIPLFFISLIFTLRRQCRSETSQMQQPPNETQLVQNQAAAAVIIGLDEPTIESYPKFVLGLDDALLEPNTGPCSICLCEYKAQDILRTIPECNHYFHSDCVDEWLKLNATCPVCRKIPDAS